MADPIVPNSPSTPPPPPNPEAAGSPPPQADTSGLQPNLAAALAAFFAPIGGFIFLALEKKNSFVRFYAMQSVFLGCGMIAVSIAAKVGAILFGLLPLIGGAFGYLLSLASALIGVAGFVLAIISAIKAFGGTEEWEMPVIGKLARKQLAGAPPAA